MMSQKKPFLHLFTLVFILSCLLPLGSFASRNKEGLLVKAADQVIPEEKGVVEEFVNGRMDIESNDYPGSGANNRHDPWGPGGD